MNRRLWFGCAAMAGALLLSPYSRAQTAPNPDAETLDDAAIAEAARADDAAIHKIIQRADAEEHAGGLRAPEKSNPGGAQRVSQSGPSSDAPKTGGLRPPPRQLAQAPSNEEPSDFSTDDDATGPNNSPPRPAPAKPRPLVTPAATPAPAPQPPPPATVVVAAPSPPPQATPPAAQPAQAPAQPAAGEFTVSPEAAQHALERALVQTGVLLLRPGEFEVVPSIGYQVNELSRPDQLVLTSTGSVLVAQDQLRNTLVTSQALARIGLPWESQFEVGVSYDIANSSTTSQVIGSNLASRTVTGSGLGDTSFSLIKQITHEGEWLPSIFISGTANIGQQDNGLLLGSGYDWFKGSVVAVKRQDPIVFTAGLSYQTNLASNGVLPGDQIVPSVGMLFALSPETSIQALQEIAFVNDTKFHGQTVPGSSQIEGIFQAGILSILGPGIVVDVTAAVAETPQAPDLTVQVSFPIRFNWSAGGILN